MPIERLAELIEAGPQSVFTTTCRGAMVSKPSVLVNFFQALVAIILGNAVYFALEPALPAAARHHRFQLDLGMVVDFCFCLGFYWLIRTTQKWR